jgi:hypothetical protein
MIFLRDRGIPVTKVYAWSDTEDNPVESEYIITSKVLGNDLRDSWDSMNHPDRFDIAEKIVGMEGKMFNNDLPACGGL